MNETLSSQIQLQDVIEFNDLLINLLDAGLPIDLDLDTVERSPKAKLDRIVSQLALQSARGETVECSLAHIPNIPIQYSDAIVAWFRSDKSTETLSPLYRVASWHREADGQLSRALLQPLTIVLLAYGAFVYIALWLTPKMESISDDMNIKTGVGLRALQLLRNTFPYWGPAFPFCLLLLVVLWNRPRLSRPRALFVRVKEKLAIRNANLAENLANLISEHTTADQAMSHMQLREGGEQSKAILPPLIRAAVSPALKLSEQRRALLDAMEIYRESARMSTERWGGWLPNVLGALVAGVIVLVTGLCLFVPIYELLTAIARP